MDASGVQGLLEEVVSLLVISRRCVFGLPCGPCLMRDGMTWHSIQVPMY